MAAKMSIKDVARVLDLPLPESNMLAKHVPERPGIELKRLLEAPLDGSNSLKEKENLNSDELAEVKNSEIFTKEKICRLVCCRKQWYSKVQCEIQESMPQESSSRRWISQN